MHAEMSPERPDPALVAQLADRAAAVRETISSAGGDPDAVTMLAVSKTRSADVAQAAVAAGLVELGENYAQELIAKSAAVTGARWHMIGAVQRNKVKKLAPIVDLWQTVDRRALADEIAKRAPGASILVQVNTSGEAQKNGCPPDDVALLVDHAAHLGLDVRGLMTVGPTDATRDPRPCFSALTALADRLGLAERSMGMTGDLAAAVAEGSTMVRIGTALFGPRPSRDVA